MLTYSFMQRAFLAAILLGGLCSLVGFFVVLRRLSFVTVGLSHAAFGGVALGILLGVSPVLSGGVFTTLVALATGTVSSRTRISEDTVIGVFFSSSMALGVVLLGLAGGYQADIFGYLFGNILAIGREDLWTLGVAGLAVTGFILYFFKELLALCFDEEMARAQGLPVTPLYLGLLVSVAVTVIVSVRLVGVILASALLVIPAATGLALSCNYRMVLVLALASALGSGLTGLVLSYWYDLASGATIVICATLVFLLASGIRMGRARRAARSTPPGEGGISRDQGP
ncbi:MAG: metal ABC transporter permease [Bacillota bacterium]|jgi:zinc transport system permease protein